MVMNLIARDSLLGMVAGPLVWAVHFLACYTLVAVACAFGFATAAGGDWGLVRIVLVFVSLVALAILAVLGLLAHRRWRRSGGSRPARDAEATRHRFMALSALLLNLLSFVSVVYVAIPLLFIPTCQ